MLSSSWAVSSPTSKSMLSASFWRSTKLALSFYACKLIVLWLKLACLDDCFSSLNSLYFSSIFCKSFLCLSFESMKLWRSERSYSSTCSIRSKALYSAELLLTFSSGSSTDCSSLFWNLRLPKPKLICSSLSSNSLVSWELFYWFFFLSEPSSAVAVSNLTTSSPLFNLLTIKSSAYFFLSWVSLNCINVFLFDWITALAISY